MNRRPSLTELEALRATIAEGSTAAAARRLHRAQSSVSRSLTQLEALLQQPLFERVGRGLRPTAEALALDQRLEAVFALLDGFETPTPPTASLTVIAPPSFGQALLPEALARFRAYAPDSRLILNIAASDQVLTAVAEGQADVGLTDTIVLHRGVRLAPFRVSKAVCALPMGHALAEKAVLTPADLRDHPHIAISRRHAMRAEIDRFFEALGITRPIIAESSSLIGALGCVRAGLGLAVMNPFPLLRTPPTGVIVRPLDPAPGYRTHFVLAAETPVSPATRRFQQILKRLASDDPWSTPA